MATQGIPEALGGSPSFLKLQEQLARIAPVNRPALLLGERGTGKELAAARLHYLSSRWTGPLIRWNCAACPADLVESELFGHEAGAFTGATRRRLGRLEQADGGTLFLDEIGQMPTSTQEKLLRALEYGTFERVGGEETLQVDVRFIAATNVDLMRACREHRFREDLLDRLAFCVVHMPPLRERQEDIVVLANHFAARMAIELGRERIPKLTPRTERKLKEHPWPGNIRELRNVIERAVVENSSDQISTLELDPFRSNISAPRESANSVDWEDSIRAINLPVDSSAFLDQIRRLLLDKALHQSSFHQRKAAALLGLTYDQFRALYRRFHPNTETATPQSSG
ncbi:MAG: sigma 54-interacting transcriptional regulator [Verrucomicrobiota bacterium]